MAGQDWKASLERLRSAIPEKHEEKAQEKAKEPPALTDADELGRLAELADALMKQLRHSQGRLGRLQKKKGKTGRGAREALRMSRGFKGPMSKFSRMLKQAVRSLEPKKEQIEGEHEQTPERVS